MDFFHQFLYIRSLQVSYTEDKIFSLAMISTKKIVGF